MWKEEFHKLLAQITRKEGVNKGQELKEEETKKTFNASQIVYYSLVIVVITKPKRCHE